MIKKIIVGLSALAMIFLILWGIYGMVFTLSHRYLFLVVVAVVQFIVVKILAEEDE